MGEAMWKQSANVEDTKIEMNEYLLIIVCYALPPVHTAVLLVIDVGSWATSSNGWFVSLIVNDMVLRRFLFPASRR